MQMKVYTSRDFDTVYDKRGINNQKHNNYTYLEGYPKLKDNIIPVWIADMDFVICESVQLAQKEIFLQNDFSTKQYENYSKNAMICLQNWLKNKHNTDIKLDWISWTQHTVVGYLDAVKALTQEGENIITLTPNYYQMHVEAQRLNRDIDPCPLKTGNNKYEIDFELLEEKLKIQKNKVLFIANPHNPTGRTWTKEELYKMSELIVKYDKYIISDDVFADLAYGTYNNIYSCHPEIGNRTINLFGPSKSFNVSGNQCSSAIIENPQIREKYRFIQGQNGFKPSIQQFACFLGCYNQYGEQYNTEMRKYLQENFHYLVEETKDYGLKMLDQEGGYLVLVQHPEISNEEMKQLFIDQDIIAQDISKFYQPPKKTQELRLNIAVPRPLLEKVVSRIKDGIENFRKSKKI